MALFSVPELKTRAQRGTPLHKSANAVLRESATLESASFAEKKQFDIFLSHSYMDADIIFGMKFSLEDLGYDVYVDWLEDQKLNRDSVTKDTAEVLRARMKSCKSLFFATTDNSNKSKWMPWELGYFDGKKNKAAILPISNVSGASNAYIGQEYLGVYPYITIGNDTLGQRCLWVRTNEKTYIYFDAWLKHDEQPYFRG